MFAALLEKKALMAAYDASRLAIGAEEGSSAQPVRNSTEYGRNDLVTLEKDGETKVLKFKKAEALLQEGWILVHKD
jgi:hypothetical protein